MTQRFELPLLLMPHIQVSRQDSAGRNSLPHAGRSEPGAGTISISVRIQPHCFLAPAAPQRLLVPHSWPRPQVHEFDSDVPSLGDTCPELLRKVCLSFLIQIMSPHHCKNLQFHIGLILLLEKVAFSALPISSKGNKVFLTLLLPAKENIVTVICFTFTLFLKPCLA